VWGEFRRTRAKSNRGQPRRPARSEQSNTKKFPFLLEEKIGTRAEPKPPQA